MAYIVSFFALITLFYVMHYFTELTRTHKISITAVLFFLIYSAIAYNTYQNERSQKLLDIVTRYNQGKTLHCTERNVTNATYSLSVGTYTFIGKKETPHYGEMIDASTCK